MKLSLYSPVLLLVYSILMTLGVVFSLTFTTPRVLNTYDLVMDMQAREQSRMDFIDKYGYWASSRGTLYTYIALPPILGFALAIALRRYIRNLLLRNEPYFGWAMRRPLVRWEGIGVKELREEVSLFPFREFLPLLPAIVVLFGFEHYVFPGSSTLVPAFLATCGFGCYGTWKRMFDAATASPESDLSSGEISA